MANALSNLAKLSFNAQSRQQFRQCVISSPRLLTDLSRDFIFEQVFYFGKLPDLRSVSEPVLVKDHDFLRRIAQLSGSTKDIAVAVTQTPKPTPLDSNARLIIAFQNINDEHLIGTSLRTAFALGFRHATFIPRLHQELFSPSGIRSHQGVLWKLPYSEMSLDGVQQFAKKEGLAVLKTEASTGSSNKGAVLLVEEGRSETDIAVEIYKLAKLYGNS